jgi:hypothetical protein
MSWIIKLKLSLTYNQYIKEGLLYDTIYIIILFIA